jgi:hypothetical protein
MIIQHSVVVKSRMLKVGYWDVSSESEIAAVGNGASRRSVRCATRLPVYQAVRASTYQALFDGLTGSLPA